MRISNKLGVLLLALALAACSNSGSSSPHVIDTGSSDVSADAAALPNYSGEVERIQGQDPRRYFIGNMPALNAVDKDGDGIWDDIQERLAKDPAIADADPRGVRLLVLGHQERMLYRSRAQAYAASPSKRSYGKACIYYMAKRAEKKASAVEAAAIEAVEKAVYTSKERVLASLYADGLASGGVFSTAPDNAESCLK